MCKKKTFFPPLTGRVSFCVVHLFSNIYHSRSKAGRFQPKQQERKQKMNMNIDLDSLKEPLMQFAKNQEKAIDQQKPVIDGITKTFDHIGTSLDRLIEFGMKQEEDRRELRKARDEVEKMRLEIEKAEIEAKLAAIRASSKASLEETAKARAEAEILEAKNELKKQQLEQKKLEHKEKEEEARHKAKLEKLEKGELGYSD